MLVLSLRQALCALGHALSDPLIVDISRGILYLVSIDRFGLRGRLLNAGWLTVGSDHANILGLSLRRLADQVVARLLLEVHMLLLYLEWLVRQERRPLLLRLLHNLLLSLLLDCRILKHFQLLVIERVTLIL